jgi:hypothetical protein
MQEYERHPGCTRRIAHAANEEANAGSLSTGPHRRLVLSRRRSCVRGGRGPSEPLVEQAREPREGFVDVEWETEADASFQ